MSFSFLKDSDNKVTGSLVTATASTTAAGYMADNAKVLPIAKVWRSIGVTGEYIEIDLGSAQSITFAAVLNHNLSSSASTINVKAGASSNPSTFTQNFTWREFDLFATFSSQNYRYWRFNFTDATNANGFIQAGYLILGTKTVPSFTFRYGMHLISEFNNRRKDTDYMVPNVEEVARRMRLSMVFGPLDSTNSDTIRKTLYESLRMDVTPFFMIPDDSVYDGWFGRFDRNLDMTIDVYRTIPIGFLEDGRGNRMNL